jgi:hypothetical protein
LVLASALVLVSALASALASGSALVLAFQNLNYRHHKHLH